MNNLDIRPAALKFLSALDAKRFKQVTSKIFEIVKNPLPQDSQRLIGTMAFRADIGEHRIIYEVEETVVRVLLVGKRNDDEVYRDFKRLN